MRFISIFIFSCLVLIFSSCKTAKIVTEDKVLLKLDSLPNGAKKLYLLKNKKLEISSLNGALIYTIENNDSTDVIHYVYAIDQEQAAFDGGYREEIVFEIPKNSSDQNYSDAELQNTKMLFGRYCFCRGQTGLYKVNEGKLHVKTSKKEMRFELQFKINEVPQVITEIKY